MVHKAHCTDSLVGRRACRRQRPAHLAQAAAAAAAGGNINQTFVSMAAPNSSGPVMTYGEGRWQLCKQMVLQRDFYWRMMLTCALIISSRIAGEQLAPACPDGQMVCFDVCKM
jgi:hypothetical protein